MAASQSQRAADVVYSDTKPQVSPGPAPIVLVWRFSPEVTLKCLVDSGSTLDISTQTVGIRHSLSCDQDYLSDFGAVVSVKNNVYLDLAQDD